MRLSNIDASTYCDSTVIPSNAWTNVAVIVDSQTSLIKTYINGVLTSSTSFPSTQAGPYVNSNAFNVGDIGNGLAADYFSGLIDDVRIYSRVLSPAEIWRIYTGSE
jgi:hypothetical protein